MVYQLETLEKWIRQEITPEILQPFSESQLKESLRFAIEQKEIVCSYFRDKAIGKPPSPTTKFIQTHQVGLSNLIDLILSYRNSNRYTLSPGIQDFYDQVSLIMEEVIQFLRQSLPEYFDNELPISQVNANLSRAELGQRLGQLDPIEQHPQMDKALFRIATRPFRDFIEEKKRITYSQLTYLNELADALRCLVNLEPNIDLVYEMHLTLWELNYNFPRYVLHFNYWLDGQLLKIQDRTERLDKLSTYLHAIEQIKVKPGFTFIPDLQPLSEQLLSSIRTTYQYLLYDDRKTDHKVVEKISLVRNGSAKINLSISVPVLALALKVMMKAGIIVNDNKADVFRAIAENFTTMKSEQISYDSLRGKFAKTPPVAYVQLRQLLMQMLEILKQF